jgi:hypothetical protein
MKNDNLGAFLVNSNIPKRKNTAAMNASQGIKDEDAVFIGWQRTSWGETFPLYNVKAANHPANGSTVTEKSLRRLHLRIPPTPVLKKAMKKSDRSKGRKS